MDQNENADVRTEKLDISLTSEDWAFVQSEVARFKREEPTATVTADQIVSTLVETGIQREHELKKPKCE